MRTEKEKMLNGELYNSADAQLVMERRRARDLLRAYNASREEAQDDRAEKIAHRRGVPLMGGLQKSLCGVWVAGINEPIVVLEVLDLALNAR